MLFLETTDVAIRDMNVTKTEKSEYAKNDVVLRLLGLTVTYTTRLHFSLNISAKFCP